MVEIISEMFNPQEKGRQHWLCYLVVMFSFASFCYDGRDWVGIVVSLLLGFFGWYTNKFVFSAYSCIIFVVVYSVCYSKQDSLVMVAVAYVIYLVIAFIEIKGK